MGRSLPLILLALVLGGSLSAALFITLSRQTSHRQLVGGEPVSYWIQCLDSGNADLRQRAVTNLPQFGVAAVDPLIERLDANSGEQSSAAASVIATIGPAAVPQLARSLRSAARSSPARRCAVIGLLRGMGAAASAPAVPAIAAQLEDPNVGPVAAEYFIEFGAGSEAIAAATKVLGGIDQQRRLDAVRVLMLAPDDPRTSAAIIASLQTSDPVVHKWVWLAAGELKLVSSAGVASLIRGLSDTETSRLAYQLLRKAGPPALEPLSELSRHPNEHVRRDAVAIILEILQRHPGKPDALEVFLNDPSPAVRTAAKGSLAALRNASPYSVPPTPRQVAMSFSSSPLSTPSLPPPLSPPSPPTTAPSRVEPAHAERMIILTPNSLRRVGEGSVVPTAAISVLASTRPVPATGGMARLKFDATLDTAIAQLDDPDESVRAAAENIVRTMVPVTTDPKQLDFSSTTDAAERLRRVRLLPFTADLRRYDFMIAALREEGDLNLRRAAVSAMGRSLNSQRVVDRLILAVQSDISPTIRCDAAEALAPLRDLPKVRSALSAAARSDRDPAVAATASEILRTGRAVR